MNKNLVITGVGGQGNIFSSGLISHYAMNRGFNVLGTETIGAAQRGGSVVSHIRISTNKIFSPLVPKGQADILLGFEPLEMLRCMERLNPKGKYLLNMYTIPTVMCNMGLDRYPDDEEIIASLERSGVEGYIIPATQRAYEIGNAILMNVVMLGALSALDSFFKEKEMKRTLEEVVSQQFSAMNIEAFEEGFSFIEQRRFNSLV